MILCVLLWEDLLDFLLKFSFCPASEDNDIILLDEPTSGLDYKHMMDISEILKELQSMGKTIIVATHDGEFIESCCSRKLII